METAGEEEKKERKEKTYSSAGIQVLMPKTVPEATAAAKVSKNKAQMVFVFEHQNIAGLAGVERIVAAVEWTVKMSVAVAAAEAPAAAGYFGGIAEVAVVMKQIEWELKKVKKMHLATKTMKTSSEAQTLRLKAFEEQMVAEMMRLQMKLMGVCLRRQEMLNLIAIDTHCYPADRTWAVHLAVPNTSMPAALWLFSVLQNSGQRAIGMPLWCLQQEQADDQKLVGCSELLKEDRLVQQEAQQPALVNAAVALSSELLLLM